MELNQFIKESLRKLGWEVNRYSINTSERALMTKLLAHYQVDLVIDVGANIGQYAQELIASGYRGAIESFEPIQEAFDQLQRTAALYPQWKIHHAAAGSSIAEIDMNISRNLVSSSLLGITQTTVEAEPNTLYTRKEKVSVITLDSFFEKGQLDLFKSPMLKLDVQGFEMEVLKGAAKLLPKIRVIQSELSFAQLYDGGPLYQEVLGFMKEHHFELYTIMPGFRDPQSGKMLQADGIFVNSDFVKT